MDEKVDMEVFGFQETLIGLDDEHKRLLIEAYGIDRYDFDAVMLLNSPSVTRNVAKMFQSNVPYRHIEEDPDGAMFFFYKMLIDYYFGDVSFALKPHPQADEKWAEAFSEFMQLPREVPMELFFLSGKRFDIICPVVSESMLLFENQGFNVTYFGHTIFNFVKQVHFVFQAFTLINVICPPSKIFIHGIEPNQLEHFKNWVFKDFKDVEFERLNGNNVRSAVFIVAEASDYCMELIRNAPKDCLIILNGSCRVDGNIFAGQEMICSISDMSEGEEVEIRRNFWTIMSKNKELLDVVREFAISYTLESSKLKIESSPRS